MNPLYQGFYLAVNVRQRVCLYVSIDTFEFVTLFPLNISFPSNAQNKYHFLRAIFLG